MAVHPSTRLVVSKETLQRVAEESIDQAKSLQRAEHYAGAMFAGGHAVECYLKVGICKTLQIEILPPVFKTHDLEALVLYSGFQRDLELTPLVKSSFDKIREVWGKTGRDSLLYQSSVSWTKKKADEFFTWLLNEEYGVIPWLSGKAV